MSARRDVLFNVADVPGLPAARQKKLYRGRVSGVVEVVRALYWRVSHTAEVDQSPRHAGARVYCVVVELSSVNVRLGIQAALVCPQVRIAVGRRTWQEICSQTLGARPLINRINRTEGACMANDKA